MGKIKFNAKRPAMVIDLNDPRVRSKLQKQAKIAADREIRNQAAHGRWKTPQNA